MSPADKISLYFPNKKILRICCQMEEDLMPFFHKMLEGLHLLRGTAHIQYDVGKEAVRTCMPTTA